MHHKLKEIISKIKQDLVKCKHSSGHFIQAIKNPQKDGFAIIAEIKLASPAEGDLGKAQEIVKRVRQYQNAGVDCISVVTEKYFFKGDPEFVRLIKQTVILPVLQKDFIVDPFQIYESKQIGTDALLLIAGILSQTKLVSLVKLTQELGMEPVVEISNINDLKKTLTANTQIIAVNARDLDTFEVDIDKACKLLKKIPDKFIKLGFSGICKKEDVKKYKKSGAKGVLIGTNLMKSKNISEYLKGIGI